MSLEDKDRQEDAREAEEHADVDDPSLIGDEEDFFVLETSDDDSDAEPEDAEPEDAEPEDADGELEFVLEIDEEFGDDLGDADEEATFVIDDSVFGDEDFGEDLGEDLDEDLDEDEVDEELFSEIEQATEALTAHVEPEPEEDSPFAADDFVLVSDSSMFEPEPEPEPPAEPEPKLELAPEEPEFAEDLEEIAAAESDTTFGDLGEIGREFEATESNDSWAALDDEFTLVDSDEGLASGVMARLDEVFTPEGETSASPDPDPIYGAREEPQAYEDEYQRVEQGPDYRELEPMLQEHEGADERQVVGALPQRGVWLRRLMVAGMAASVLICGIVAFVSLRPNLPFAQKVRGFLGLTAKERVTVEVATVARPTVSLRVNVPAVPIPNGMRVADAGPETGGKPDKISERSRRRFEKLMAGMGWLSDRAGKLAVGYVKQHKKNLVARARPKPPLPKPPVKATPDTPKGGEVVAKGPDKPANQGGRETGEPGKQATPATGKLLPMTAFNAGVVRGTKAFAQLHNGHFFVGRVQKIVPEKLVMILPNGEITFVPGELQKLLPLADAEAQILSSGPDGYVRLKNRNQIWGKILENLPDVVTIQRGDDRIVIPRGSILEVSKKATPKIKLGAEEENWGEDTVPEVDLPLPEVETANKKEELPSGAIRIKIGSTSSERAKRLKGRIERALPKPLRK